MSFKLPSEVKAVSIDELKAKFGPPLDVAPYGECIVIQGSEFNPDWEAELGDLGFKCHFGDLDGHAVSFVQLKRAVAEGKVVYVPPKVPEVYPEIGKAQPMVEKKKYALKGPTWTLEDEAELLKAYDGLVLEGKKYGSHKIIAELPQFKGRSIKSIDMKFKRLLKKRRKSEDAAGSQVAEVEQVDKVEEVEKVEKPEAQPELIAKPKQVHGNPRPKMPWLKDVEFWSPEEDALIVELWKKGLTFAEISVEVNKKYPKRSGYAVRGRVYQLQGKGMIEKRHKPKLKAANAPKEEKEDSSKHSPIEVPVVESDKSTEVVGPVSFVEVASVETTLQTLTEAYRSLSTVFVELKTDLSNLRDFVEANLAVKYKVANLERNLILHKHAVSGEAMLPMESS